jgi:hypothetical protein
MPLTFLIGENGLGKCDYAIKQMNAKREARQRASIAYCPENERHFSKYQETIDELRKYSDWSETHYYVITYSPYILNYAEPEEVLVFYRDNKEEVVIRPITEATDLKKNLKTFGLGEWWFLVVGLFGGEIKLFDNEAVNKKTWTPSCFPGQNKGEDPCLNISITKPTLKPSDGI